MFIQCTDLIKTDQDRICFLFLPGKKGTCFYSSFLYFSQKTLLCSCIVKGVKEKKLIGMLSSSISTLLKLCTRLVGTNQVDWKELSACFFLFTDSIVISMDVKRHPDCLCLTKAEGIESLRVCKRCHPVLGLFVFENTHRRERSNN